VKNGYPRARFFCALVLGATLGGCAFGPRQQEQPASYDLGPSRALSGSGPVIPATLLLPGVGAPAWLDGRGIVYRLSYENAARPQAYALSRWAAPPAALLTQRLRGRFAAAVASGIVTEADGARAEYVLRVELDDFTQSFTAPGTSRITVRVRASLLDTPTRTLLGQRVFAVERPAPTPDARGAVAAFGEASDDVIENLVAWVSERLGAKRR
jgi:cholesterol transport system auxiliary component